MNIFFKKLNFLILAVVLSVPMYAQQNSNITLERAIEMARAQSPNALMAQLSFMSNYWSFRSYKAQLLPSLNLTSSLGSYNRSLVEVRNSDTGEISYVANNSLTNSVGLSVVQNVALTGGVISLTSDLTRLDQFDYDNTIYSTTPVSVNYSQPIRGFNSLKWEKETAPREYENSKRTYLETMESITMTTTAYFFAVISAQTNYEKAIANSEDTKRLYKIAEERFEIAMIDKSELLQLKLSLLNSNLAISTAKVAYDVALFNFKSYIGISKTHPYAAYLVPPTDTPDIILNFDQVLEKAYENSSHKLTQELTIINAKYTVAQAKASKGIQIDFSANLGYSKTDYSFNAAYKNPIDKEVIGITLSMPIYDWGMSRGEVKMAEAQERLALTEIEQEEEEFVQDIKIKVLEFNNQSSQCKISLEAKQIADERYEITKSRFETGLITVTELKTAQEERDDAQSQYITQLSTYWSNYFEIQKLSLYDFINKKNISTEFDNLID